MGEGQKALMILLKNDFRVALVTGHVPVREIAQDITKELIMEKLAVFHRSLKEDFGIDSPRIAVFSLNPHAGDEGLIGTEESDIIIPAMKEMVAKGIQCFGPYPADGFMGSGNYTHFDGILAMYHDQGMVLRMILPDKGLPWKILFARLSMWLWMFSVIGLSKKKSMHIHCVNSIMRNGMIAIN